MNSATKALSSMALYCAAGAALAQQQSAPPPATPAGSDTPAVSAAPAAPLKPSKATAQSEAGEPRADTSNPASTGRTPAAARAAPGAAAGQKSPAKVDRLELGTATVTGDREQPKVMYIVPWKKSDIGDLAGKPMNSLVDEILAPVDRDVFKREVIYYQAVQADASQNGAPPRPAQQGEK
jgi:hypothetical protein